MIGPNEKQDPVDLLAEAVRSQPIPPGPVTAVQEELLAKLTERGATPPVSNWKRKTMRRILSTAALAAMIWGAAALMPTDVGTNSGAYAAMIEQLREIKTLSFTTNVAVQGKAGISVRTHVLNPDQVREEVLVQHDAATEPQLQSVLIHDRKVGKVLTLTEAEKKAKLTDLGKSTPQSIQFDVIEKFRGMREEDAEPLGRERVNGVETLKYKYGKPDGYYLVWLAPDTQLPVKVVVSESAGSNQGGMQLVMTDFRWNPQFNSALFNLTIPDGYQLERSTMTLADRERQGQEGLVWMLGYYVRLHDNEFPEQFNVLTFASVMSKVVKPGATPQEQADYETQQLAKALDQPEVLDMTADERQELAKENSRKGAIGGAYLHMLMETQVWHYQGKGVKLGDADSIVAWWHPHEDLFGEFGGEFGGYGGGEFRGRGPSTAHVLYGDLRIEQRPISELPKPADD